jgi:spore germination protein GerM
MSTMNRLGIAALVIAVLAWAVWRWTAPPRVTDTSGLVRADSASVGFKAARLYFAAPSGDSLVSETREMMEVQNLHERMAALIGELDRGPTAVGVAVVPAGTALLHVYLDDRGTMTLDLSRAFQQGFRGGSTAEALAIGSLARTVADNVPEVKRVLITCGGAPLATLGGHLALDRPIEISSLP